MKRKAPYSSNSLLPTLLATGITISAIAAGFWWQQQQLPVTTTLVIDMSDSMRNSGRFEHVTKAVCQGSKQHITDGDRFVVMPFAATSSVTHNVRIENRLDVLSLCNQKFSDFLDQGDVSQQHGTSLHRAVESLLQQQQQKSSRDQSGKHKAMVIQLLIHADDQGVGADRAIALTETTELIQKLLKTQTVLVVFAVEPKLRRELANTLNHSRVRISPVSEQSIKDSLEWAYQMVRRNAQPGE